MMADNDAISEVGGDDEFMQGASASAGRSARVGVNRASGASAFRRAVPAPSGWGRGPVEVDTRKFRYDLNAAVSKPGVAFSATKVDRLDAKVAGDMLDRIHKMFGIDRESENRIFAFDQALWYEHAVNGGSTLQAARGVIEVDNVQFDISEIVKLLGVDARRFFRAYADDISVCLRKILAEYTPYEPESAEKHGAIMQVAVARGLQKYPFLIHDSSDAGIALSIEERVALQSSKRAVIASTVNAADSVVGRVPRAAGFGSSAAVHFDEQ